MRGIVLMAVAIARVASAQPPPTHPALRQTLLEMAREDQATGRAVMGSRPGQPGDDEVQRRSRQTHERNASLIRAIVAEFGWPGKTTVGVDGARAAWLIVQHRDEAPAFQRQCLGLMEVALRAGEVEVEDFAYLTDRVLVNEGKRQMYGTQGNGAATPEEERRIDGHRKALGLDPWREFVARMARGRKP